MKSPDQEYQLLYANDLLQRNSYDYFIFGHRHIPCLLKLNDDATFINIGDWITFNTYAVFDGSETLLVKY
jgi:UDP-2,3-diacylglucosamine hydrolase